MRLARIGTVLLLVYASCGGGNVTGNDAGEVVPVDAAGRIDAGTAAPFEEGPICFDGVDNDGDTRADCADDGCTDRVCCIASAAPTCCTAAPDQPVVAIDTCADGPASDCLTTAGIALFGDTLPAIEDGALVPEGGLSYGGVALAEPVDSRARNIELRASIEVPPELMRCTDCTDAAGIGLFAELPDGGSRVALGALAIGSLNDLVVMVADEVVFRTDLTEGTHALTVSAGIDGTVSVEDNGSVLATIPGISLPSLVWPAAFGRTANRSPGVEAVTVVSATLGTSTCDAPGALVRRSTPVLPWSGATWDPDEVRGPSIASWVEVGGAEQILMVYSYDGQIYGAERTGVGEFRALAGDPGPPLVNLPAGITGARDPSLVEHDNQLSIFFVGIGSGGATSIWKTSGGPGHQTMFTESVEIMDPADLQVRSIDGVSVEAGTTTWRMLARVEAPEGSRIVELESSNMGLSWQWRNGSLDDATLRRAQAADLFAFDRDEVAAPVRVLHADMSGQTVERIYYAGRRGTRWSIGLLVSSDGTSWRPMGAVLEGRDTAGFDSLGVTDPAPFVDGATLRLYYAGTDGQRYRIGEAGPAGTVGE